MIATPGTFRCVSTPHVPGVVITASVGWGRAVVEPPAVILPDPDQPACTTTTASCISATGLRISITSEFSDAEAEVQTVAEIVRGRHKAEIDGDFVVFLIGARFNCST